MPSHGPASDETSPAARRGRIRFLTSYQTFEQVIERETMRLSHAFGPTDQATVTMERATTTR